MGSWPARLGSPQPILSEEPHVHIRTPPPPYHGGAGCGGGTGPRGGAADASVGADKPAAPGKTQMNVQLLSFNDFHGNLEPPTGSSGVTTTGYTEGPLTDSSGKPILNPDGSPKIGAIPTNVPTGGVAYLASKLRALRAGHPNSVTVAAGDLIGASPLISAAFHDEPTIQAMNELGLEVTSVGNHEFDEGYQELQRMQNGGCIDDGDGLNNQNSCPDGSFAGANFHYLSANVKYAGTDKTDPAAVLDQEHQRRQDRLHRHDTQGDTEHRHGGRRRRPGVHRRGRPPRTRSCLCCERKVSRRSSCCCTRAGSRRPSTSPAPPAPRIRSRRPTTSPAPRATRSSGRTRRSSRSPSTWTRRST